MINDIIALSFQLAVVAGTFGVGLNDFHDMVSLFVLWCLMITSLRVVAGKLFERIRNDSLFSMSNEVPEFIFVPVILSCREGILFLSSQSCQVSLMRYYNGIPADPMKVTSSCTIWDLTSYHFVPMKEVIVTKNTVL